MKRDDDIRRALRDADPARNRELSPVDRARMRASVMDAARERQPRRAGLPLLAVGAALAAVVAVVAMVSRGDRSVPIQAARLPQPVPSAPVMATPGPEPTPSPSIARLSPPPHPRHLRPQVARLEGTPRTTRIVLTAPEGTRILWFVGSPDAKELGS